MIDLRRGDCLEVMKDIPDGSVDLVLTSPPYNISKSKGKAYALKYRGYEDCMENEQYIEWLIKIFDKINRILSKNGVVFVEYELWNKQ